MIHPPSQFQWIPPMTTARKRLIALSGPSCGGKGPLLAAAAEFHADLELLHFCRDQEPRVTQRRAPARRDGHLERSGLFSASGGNRIPRGRSIYPRGEPRYSRRCWISSGSCRLAPRSWSWKPARRSHARSLLPTIFATSTSPPCSVSPLGSRGDRAFESVRGRCGRVPQGTWCPAGC